MFVSVRVLVVIDGWLFFEDSLLKGLFAEVWAWLGNKKGMIILSGTWNSWKLLTTQAKGQGRGWELYSRTQELLAWKRSHKIGAVSKEETKLGIICTIISTSFHFLLFCWCFLLRKAMSRAQAFDFAYSSFQHFLTKRWGATLTLLSLSPSWDH